VEIIGADGRITALRIEQNELVMDPNGALRSRGVGQFEIIPTGLVLRSIGYRTVPIEGVPFDPATSTINNVAGQVIHPNTGEVVHGEYVVGWAKRGPTGLIGNNKPDAAATVDAMLADLPALQRLGDNRRDPSQIETLPGARHPLCDVWGLADPGSVRGCRRPHPGTSARQGHNGSRDDGGYPRGAMTTGPAASIVRVPGRATPPAGVPARGGRPT
jgi:hypothetical protein